MRDLRSAAALLVLAGVAAAAVALNQTPAHTAVITSPEGDGSEAAPAPPSPPTDEVLPLILPDTGLGGDPSLDLGTTTTLAPTTTIAAKRTSSTTTTQPATTTTAAQSGYFDSKAESQFVARINQLRKSEGMAPLTRNGSLDSEARSWAKYMASKGELSHSKLERLMPPWSAAGENLGMGGSVDAIWNSLSGSGAHTSIMLGDFTHLGVGVWVDSDGTLWTTHIFTR